ncbi:ATP-binding protein [Actinokineospora sp. NBRC 105648]|uniref:AAA family ATPase n=1 Tax=Actinokineospora sp. NBRC 105648 TaxID=3032206 RepID=UPI0025570856|nr:ATP-binding protein [Actinokineospora sp. NBRC 105648]
MLIRFEVSNFRSILESVELSLVAVDLDREEARPIANIGASLLPVAAIYGPNASGKSNILAALSWLRSAVGNSLRLWDDVIPVEPFAFADGAGRMSEFTLELTVAGVRFEYVVELTRDAVHYEGLFHYPEKKRRRVFERVGGELTLQRGLGSLSGTRELLTPRTLALSVARRFGEPVVSGFAQQLLDVQILGPQPRTRRGFLDLRSTRRLFDENTDDNQLTLDDAGGGPAESRRASREQALALLRMADLGIDDVLVEDHQVVLGSDPEQVRTQRRVRLVHRTEHERAPLSFSAESEGTRTWFETIGPVLAALGSGSLVLFDELDASLHPTLSMHLVRLFQSPATNPLGAQLVFTSHDTSLLNHLNRDEVWLTEKAKDGTTRLGALAEFAGERVRRSQNLEKAYLHGRFGALPEVDRVEMLRALGLIG